jgi:hypothetical protein
MFKNYKMIKKEFYETLSEDQLTISIGKMTGRLIIVTMQEGVQFEKEEVADLIQVLKEFYVRMD